MKRSAAASDDSGRVDSYSPGSVTYFSPALSLEAAVHFRLNPAFAVSIGAEFWADNASAGGTNTTPPSTGHALLNPATPATAVPIPTPQYHQATGPQVLLGPFIGLQFGP